MTDINPSVYAYTLTDILKQNLPDGTPAPIINSLTKISSFVRDLKYLESNLPDGHMMTTLTSLPTVYKSRINKGVPASKASNRQYKETFEMLSTRCELDDRLLSVNGYSSEYVLQQAMPHFEAMGQAIANKMFYGSRVGDPDSIIGLTYRYNSLTATDDNPQYENVIDCGGRGSDNTSIWVISSGENKIHGIYPKGSKSGIQQNIKNMESMIADDDGNTYKGRINEWTINHGLCVADWRYAVRLANIDVSDLKNLQGTQASDSAYRIGLKLYQAMDYFPESSSAVIYCNRTAKAALNQLGLIKVEASLPFAQAANQFGKVSPGSVASVDYNFLGVPVRVEDTLLNTEAAVV